MDNDHYAMDKLKRRVLEYLAVRQLKTSLKVSPHCRVLDLSPQGGEDRMVGQSEPRLSPRIWFDLC